MEKDFRFNDQLLKFCRMKGITRDSGFIVTIIDS